MEIRNVSQLLPAALLLITVGSPPAHADRDRSKWDDSGRKTQLYPDNPVQLRSLIDQQVGIEKLKVPARNSDIPLPPDDPARPNFDR